MNKTNMMHASRYPGGTWWRQVIGIAALSLATCSLASAEGKLNVYNWGSYINPEVLTRFGDEFDVDVTLDTYTSNQEMLAKLQAGAKGYDIVFPSVWMHDVMHQLGLLAKTHIGQYEGFKENIDPQTVRAKTDPDAEYCLPYAAGSVGILYNKEIVGEGKIKGWQDFFDLAASGKKVSLLPDPRETLGIGLIMTGASVNSEDPDELRTAGQYIIDNLNNVAALSYNVTPLVTSGDLAAAHYYVGGYKYVLQHPDTLDYIVPEEGGTLYQEDMCVLASAPNKDNAIKFLEFFTRPEIAALNAEEELNFTPNVSAHALISDWIVENPKLYPPQDVTDKLQLFYDIGDSIRLYTDEWERIRTSASTQK